MKKLSYTCGYTLLLILISIHATAQGQDHREFGDAAFTLSCTQEANETFQEGVALLHHMMYEQAEAVFTKVAETDPDCAMAQWGIAMSVIHPLWGERPSDEDLEKGRRAIEQARAAGPSDEREAAYIAALEPVFESWEATSYPDQLIAFEEGYRELYEEYPDDINAGAFYALGHLATAPKDDQTLSHQKKAGQLLEELHREAPMHPGLFHYTIHAYDNPVLAERAVEVARNYDQIAPEVPHALHMPSHIFVRLGIWSDVIQWNTRSANAALKQPVGDQTSMHYAHALDYLAYAHLQRGEDQEAQVILDKLHDVDNLQQNFAAAYAVAATIARFPLEREQWEEAAELSVEPPNNFPLHQYPAAESILHFTRGIGSARMDDPDGALLAMNKLDTLHSQLLEAGESYWAVLTEVQKTAIEAWMEYSVGNEERALTLMKEAADKEDSVDKHPVTPGHVLPARELLGDMLLESSHPAEALEAYKASLETSANRFRSLFGVAQAAELTGDTTLALASYKRLIALSTEMNNERPQLDRAKQFVTRNNQ